MKKLPLLIVFFFVAVAAFAQNEREDYTKVTNAIIRGKDAVQMDSLYQVMLKQFSDYRRTLPAGLKDVAARAVAYAYIAKKDTVKASHYIALFSDQPTITTQYYGMVKAAQRASLNQYAENLLHQIIRIYEKHDVKPDPKGDPLGFANNQVKYGIMFYTEYALSLTGRGLAVKGLPYAKKAYELDKKDKIALTTYAKLLSDNKLYAESFPVLEEAIRLGVADGALQENYRQAYLALRGVNGYESRISYLKDQQKIELLAQAQKRMISETAPVFSLQDTQGKTWSLGELKGKTLILDFWATWCAPCKKSFPAMQMAVNKYKNDPDVVFLFIHTWERSNTALEDADKYIKTNNYNFKVLMDLKKNGRNEAITAYKAEGIPAKFIIDGKGNIRFKITGFSGSNEAAVSELSAMIELAKKS